MSLLKRDDVLPWVDSNVGVTRWSLEALKLLTDVRTDVAKKITACADGLLHELERLRRCEDVSGIFTDWKGYPKDELAWTSVIGCELAWHQLHEKLRWYHQLKAANGEIDILATVDLVGTGDGAIRVPVAVFEIGWNVSDKTWQSIGYASNFCKSLDVGGEFLDIPTLAVTWTFEKNKPATTNGTIAIRVLGFHPHAAAEKKFSAIPVWRATNSTENVARALNAVVQLSDAIVASEIDSSSRLWEYPSRTVAIETTKDGKFVHKLYDYRSEIRGEETGSDQRRKHQRMIRHGTNVEYEIGDKSSDLVVLRYPYIVGGHIASSAKHFIRAIEKIKELHEGDGDGITVHGDIRGSNLIFDTDDGCSLIDFDLTGTSSDKYPATYVHDNLVDVRRHPEAKPGESLKTIHDWYALASIMEMYAVDGDDGFWVQATISIREGKASDALDCLKPHESMTIKPADDDLAAILSKQQGTGTPEKKKGRSSSPQKKQKL